MRGKAAWPRQWLKRSRVRALTGWWIFLNLISYLFCVLWFAHPPESRESWKAHIPCGRDFCRSGASIFHELAGMMRSDLVDVDGLVENRVDDHPDHGEAIAGEPQLLACTNGSHRVHR